MISPEDIQTERNRVEQFLKATADGDRYLIAAVCFYVRGLSVCLGEEPPLTWSFEKAREYLEGLLRQEVADTIDEAHSSPDSAQVLVDDPGDVGGTE